MKLFNHKRKKKGQAAMEFLMTYGWAILIVLVVIGALAYFGVLTPSQFLPTRCTLATGLVCVDKQVTTAGEVQLRINNGLGKSITLKEVYINDSTGTFTACESSDALSSDVDLLPGQEKNIGPFSCAASGEGGEIGTRIKAAITLKYTDKTSGFDHTIVGTLMADVE